MKGRKKEYTNENNFVASKSYEDSLEISKKKLGGIYYTPKEIVEYIINETLAKHDILKNPCPKVLDISCGCGNFLLEAYDVLFNLIKNNLQKLNEIYGDEFQKDNIHNYILTNCIYGYDIDQNAIDILKNELKNKAKNNDYQKMNVYCKDSLKHEFKEKFDYIIGNPPYIGQKKIEKEYKKFLLKEYEKTYKNKSDLYYCFYQKIIDILKESGICSIITPRYFIESPSGEHLRNYITQNVCIKEIIDFLGVRVFKNAGVCSAILTLEKSQIKNTKIKIYRPKNEDIKIKNLKELIKKDEFESFEINQNELLKDWIISNEKNKILYYKIEEKAKFKLNEIATSFQGIITGCDKAFIINVNDEKIERINKNLLKNWIKNKNVNQYKISKGQYKLIYSDDIKSEDDYPIEIKEIIGKHKEKLSKRRECVKNIRKWYKLQWGREKDYFEQVKIMYPYKSSKNKFAIDYNNSFCSADVYSFFIKEQYKKEFSYEYLVGILNSQVYDKYYKINAKKISKNVYDYYPNKVMKIKIFKDENYNKIEKLSKYIIKNIEHENKTQRAKDEIEKLIKESLDIKSLI